MRFLNRNLVVLGLALFFLVFGSTAVFAADSNQETPYSDKGAWPRYHHDNNGTGHSSVVGSPTNKVKWKYDIKSKNNDVQGSPAVDSKGNIYVGSTDNHLYCFNPDGTLKWKYKTKGDVDGTPAVDSKGNIYFGSEFDALYCLRSDGTLKWKHGECGVEPSPVIDSKGNIYYAGNGVAFNTPLICLSSNGILKWKYKTKDDVLSPVAITSSGNIIFTGDWGHVYCLKEDGSLRWMYSTDPFRCNVAPAIDTQGRIYVGTFQEMGGGENVLICINPDGTLRWNYEFKKDMLSSPAIDSKGNIYFGTSDLQEPTPGPYYLYCVKPDGTLNWRYATSAAIYSAPAIDSQGNIYFGSINGYLYSITSGGTLRWKASIGAIFKDPVIGPDGTIYVVTAKGVLYAIGENKTPSPNPSPNQVHGKTVPMQPTGIPINLLLMAVGMVLCGLVLPAIKK